MNELPLEILSSILDLFFLKEKLKLREVCKKFLFVIDNRPGKSLVIKGKGHGLGDVWFDNWKVVSLDNLIDYEVNVRIFNSKLFKSRFFINLKKLHLHFFYISDDKEVKIPLKQLTFLNNFQQLETLYLDLPERLVLSRTVKIELQELKNLEIDGPSDILFYVYKKPIKHHISFDCPKLSFIIAESFAFLTIANPETVTRIETCIVKVPDLARLGIFVNLECCEIFTDFNVQRLKELLSRWKHLKILGLGRPRTKKELIELKQSMEESTIEVYLGGVHISRWDPQCWDNLDNLDFLKFYLDNDQFHRFRAPINVVNYTHILEFIDDQLSVPINFKNRLVDLKKVVVTKKIDRVDKFIKFIANCKLLSIMFLKNSSLGDEFYSILPNYLPYLRSLSISDDDENRISNINFSFLLKLGLSRFETDYQLDLSLIKNLVLSNTKMEALRCLFEDQMISVASFTGKPSEHRTPENFQLKQFQLELNEELERRSMRTIIVKHLINYEIN